MNVSSAHSTILDNLYKVFPGLRQHTIPENKTTAALSTITSTVAGLAINNLGPVLAFNLSTRTAGYTATLIYAATVGPPTLPVWLPVVTSSVVALSVTAVANAVLRRRAASSSGLQQQICRVRNETDRLRLELGKCGNGESKALEEEFKERMLELERLETKARLEAPLSPLEKTLEEFRNLKVEVAEIRNTMSDPTISKEALLSTNERLMKALPELDALEKRIELEANNAHILPSCPEEGVAALQELKRAQEETVEEIKEQLEVELPSEEKDALARALDGAKEEERYISNLIDSAQNKINNEFDPIK